MNTPRLRSGGRIAPLSLFLLVVVLLEYILFVTKLPSWSDGLYCLGGFPALTRFLFF